MKFVVLVIVLCSIISVQALTDEQKAKVKQHHTDCITDSKVEPELVKKAREGDFSDDAKLKDFILCFLKKSQIMNDVGEIQIDVIKKKLSADAKESEINAVVDKCKDTKGSPADIAAEFWKCYWHNSPKHIPLL